MPGRRGRRTPNAVTGRVGLRDDDGKAPAGLALDLPPDTLAAFAAACSLDETEARALTLADRAGVLLAQQGRRRNDSLLQAASAAWISPGRTRYCPECLRGDDLRPGYWRASWQLPWHFACLRHLRLLADDCPACRAPVGRATPRGPFGALVPNPGGEGLRFDACRHRPGASTRLCGHPLTDQPDDEHRTTDVDPRALAAQVRLDELLGLDHPSDPNAQPTLAGEPLALPLWAPALHGVAVLVRASLGLPGAPAPGHALAGLALRLADPATSTAERRRLLHTSTPPDGAWAAAELAAAAVHVLDAPTRGDLADRLAPYRDPVREHRPEAWKSWLRQYPDARAKALLKRHQRWTGLAAAGRTAAPPAGLRGRHLAQRVLPPHDRLLDPFRHLPVSDTGLHRATTVLLWQRCESGTRADAAAALGYDEPSTVDGTVARLHKHLAAAGLADVYDRALADLGAALAAGPLTDYAARRSVLADWAVPDDDWDELKAALVPLQKRDGRQPDWDLRRTVIGQNVWEDLTGSEPHASPAFRALVDSKARTRLRWVSQQFRANVATGKLPGFASALDRYRDGVLARTLRADR